MSNTLRCPNCGYHGESLECPRCWFKAKPAGVEGAAPASPVEEKPAPEAAVVQSGNSSMENASEQVGENKPVGESTAQALPVAQSPA